MKNFHVEFKFEGKLRRKTFEGVDAGHAFAACLRKFKGATLIHCSIQRRFKDGSVMFMRYDPPSTAGPEPLPKEKLKQQDFGFNDPRKEKTPRGQKKV